MVEPAPGIADQQEPEGATEAGLYYRLFRKELYAAVFRKTRSLPILGKCFVSHKNFIAKKKAGHEEPAFQRGIKD